VKFMEIIDLSVLIEDKMPVPSENDEGYTDPPVSIVSWVGLDTKDFAVTKIEMGTHTGTHCDVTAHVVQGGKNVLDFPIETWVGWATVMDFKDIKDVSIEHVKKYAHMIRKDTILIIRNSSTDFISEDARNEIISLKPKSIIFGRGTNQRGIEDTLAYLRAGIPMIMHADYDSLDYVESNDLIVALPLKIKNVEAAPMRLVAIRGLCDIGD
jgi:Predicted metal-dependent hydrolase